MLLSGSLKLKSISQCCHKLKIFPHLTRHYKYDKVPCCVMFVYRVHVMGDRMIETTCCRLAALRDELARCVDACRAEPQWLTTPTPLHRPSLGCHTSNSPQVYVGVFCSFLAVCIRHSTVCEVNEQNTSRTFLLAPVHFAGPCASLLPSHHGDVIVPHHHHHHHHHHFRLFCSCHTQLITHIQVLQFTLYTNCVKPSSILTGRQ